MPSSSVARQLAAAPMMILPIRIEHALNMAFKALMTPIRANIVGLRNSATGIRLSIAACRRLVARCHARAERTVHNLRRRFNFGCTRLQSAAPGCGFGRLFLRLELGELHELDKHPRQ